MVGTRGFEPLDPYRVKVPQNAAIVCPKTSADEMCVFR